MRRIVFITLAAAAIAACSNETTAPDTADLSNDAGAYGTAFTVAGGFEPDLYQDRLTNGLPDSIALTADQKTKIKALVDAFQTSTKADHQALDALLKSIHQLNRPHSTTGADSVGKLLTKAAEITQRLAAAQAKLKSDIDAILTPAQIAWLASHEPKNCKPARFPPLSDAQKAQIKALEDAFQTNNKADLDAVKAALDSAKGKTKEEREAILAAVKPAQARLEAARKALREAIKAVLTSEQKSSGCDPLG
jgi:Spy/CpxP family protein refolding chaperone